HWAEEGAYTGEVAPRMLTEIGVYGSLVGHSERRQLFGETDETVRRRVEGALAAGLWVIACVGELEAEREGGETEEGLRRQVSERRAPSTGGGAGRPGRGMRSVWPTRPSSTGFGRSIRTRRSRPPARRSASLPARWGTPRSGT